MFRKSLAIAILIVLAFNSSPYTTLTKSGFPVEFIYPTASVIPEG